MQEIGLADVCSSIETAFREEKLDRVEAFLWPALDQFPHESRLWFYAGGVHFKKGNVAVAKAMFEQAINLDDAPHIYSNLGACYRRMNLHNEGIHVLKNCIERIPDYCPALVNLGSMYVNEGQPNSGIPYLERAMGIDTEAEGAAWNLGLLYLEAARFKEGFELYRRGVKKERQVRTYGSVKEGIKDPELLTPETFAEIHGSGKRQTLITFGEQGIGDELMFGTILNDAIEDFEIIFECHPRLEKLHRNSSWANRLRSDGRQARMYPTRKDEWIRWPIDDKVTADYKCPIGDLAAYYRPDLASFKASREKHGPTYFANPQEADRYRRKLQTLAGERPIVGLATKGGVIQTSRLYRCIGHKEIDRLMTETDALFVSLDYDDVTPLAYYIEDKYGPDRFRWWPAIVQHWDYDHTAALVASFDLTVTVCQSVAHIAAGSGYPTVVLASKRAAWREIKTDNDGSWYWYPAGNVRMYHQESAMDWNYPISKAIQVINALEYKKEAA